MSEPKHPVESDAGTGCPPGWHGPWRDGVCVDCGELEQTAENVAPRWIFGPEAACRYIAATSWPWERVENRDAWAVTMLHRPDLLATEIARARERLESAIACVTPPRDPAAAPTSDRRARGGVGHDVDA